MSNNIHTLNSISIRDIIDNNYILSSSKYSMFLPQNTNLTFVKDYLEEVSTKNKGIEIGANSYVDKSNYFFVKTKAMQDYSFLLNINEKSYEFIKPSAFKKYDLKKGEILIAKDCKVEPIILEKDYPNYMISGGIYKLIPKKQSLYLFAFLKSHIIQEQLEFMIARGANRKHAGTAFLYCQIPVPNINTDNTIKYVELLTQAIINKESQIRANYNKIFQLIKDELNTHQKSDTFTYKCITNKDILNSKQIRLDASLYTEDFKRREFHIRNYEFGCFHIDDLGFQMDRGQNLQVSNIGKSIYSDIPIENFYTLINPTNISIYGTVQNLKYIGNNRITKLLKKGDIVFGAEGTYRSLVIIEEKEKTISNIHGLIIKHKNNNMQKSVFIKCYIDYLKEIGLINSYASGGRGGSLSPEYWNPILFPNFPEEKEKTITKLYHNSEVIYTPEKCTLDNFGDYDEKFNSNAGIYELDKIAKILKSKLNQIIQDIADDKEIKTTFDDLKL